MLFSSLPSFLPWLVSRPFLRHMDTHRGSPQDCFTLDSYAQVAWTSKTGSAAFLPLLSQMIRASKMWAKILRFSEAKCRAVKSGETNKGKQSQRSINFHRDLLRVIAADLRKIGDTSVNRVLSCSLDGLELSFTATAIGSHMRSGEWLSQR